ncbi:HAMP domain-containing protein [Rhodococcus hoagii]|nr:HAMP domain-containing protein [Prescottella equi]MBM4528412.1 HAMP domain-containing protein [Prescottella equi]MBM4545890.1 HAMP domain-containing protein [Prescottella equi]MBM4572649.1 HAMP domain-containing protein [Prescottella equi]MBM4602577.1 HAMP domain-containing protein [Prescottella equi]
MSVPEDALSRAIREQQWQVAGVAVAAIAVAAGLGWLLAGRAVRPLQRLAAATHTVGDELPASLPDIRGAREAEELGEAIRHMLDRIGKAQSRTQDALGAARDFAAVSAHELRTPLTSMRTDLEVLATMPLTETQRAEILRELRSTERQIESTLTDLESLAVGELSDPADHEDVDLVELADRCVQESSRRLPDVDVRLTAPASSSPMRGLPSGLRSVLDNAVTNAVRHGRADRIEITVAATAHAITITVDDNGVGVGRRADGGVRALRPRSVRPPRRVRARARTRRPTSRTARRHRRTDRQSARRCPAAARPAENRLTETIAPARP